MYYNIDEAAAQHAHSSNSFSTYKLGSTSEEYRQLVDTAKEIGRQQKERVDPIHHEKIDKMVNCYARRLANYFNHYSQVEASCPSVLITGAGNFPVRKKEKQNARRAAVHNEWEACEEYLQRIKTVGTGGIQTGDPKAVEKLQNKLASLQEHQQHMRALNAYYRKHKTCKGFAGFTEEQAAQMDANILSRESWMRGVPFLPYELSNNNANIHRVENRLKGLEQAKEKDICEESSSAGYTYREDSTIMRVQFIFEEKPEAEVRALLKSFGFRWAPSQSAWQRQLTPQGKKAAQRVKERLSNY